MMILEVRLSLQTPALIVIHERRGEWARQLRPRVGDRAARWFESRSTDDLLGVVRGVAVPIVVLDLAKRARIELEALIHLERAADRPLVLALEPEARAEVADLARELGATLVLSGFAPPPKVADLLRRWLDVSQARRSGWSASPPPRPEDPR